MSECSRTTGHSHTARLVLACCALLVLISAAPQHGRADDKQNTPRLKRIEMVTIGTDDVSGFTAAYKRWLGYQTAESGTVPQSLAESWGAPESGGRAYVLLHSEGTDDVFLRVVDVDVPETHEAMTTVGWSVLELLVQDPDAVYGRLLQLQSPFRHIGGPANLGGGTSSIRATQFVGPAAVAVYLTADTAPEDTALLPRAKSFVDRPFIVVLATEDADATDRFYRSHFALGGYPPRPVNVGVVADALGLSSDHLTPLGLGSAAEKGNFIEIDGYPSPARSRPRAPGQLPSGVAMVSFSVDDLDDLALPYITSPARRYGDRRSATFAGTAGELMELIEARPEDRP